MVTVNRSQSALPSPHDSSPQGQQQGQREQRRQLMFGLLILGIMTYLAYGLAGGLQNRLSQNPLLIAVIFGIFVGNLFTVPQFMKPAINFTTAYFIKAGVVLVGLKISAQVIISMGYKPVLVAGGELVAIFLFTHFFLSRVMRFDKALSTLIAAGSSICGAAAIMAIATVVSAPTAAKNRAVTLSVTLITLMGTLQLFLYPYLYHQGAFSHLNDQLFGIFAGSSIYEFAQVYGAGYAVSDTAINFATLVKLMKVMMLVPMVFIVSHFDQRSAGEEAGSRTVKFPIFILFFMGVVILNSLFNIHGTVKFALGQAGSFMFLMAMVALGLKTNLRNIVQEHNVKKLVSATAVIIAVTTAVGYGLTVGSTVNLQAALQGDGSAIAQAFQQNHYGGKEIFSNVGCAKCHIESLPTRRGDELTLYSDLLIHDMGPELDDKIIQGDAIGTDWRTTPLAGIGGRDRFLHDGRAFTYRDAIIAHGGEAKIVRDRFIDLKNSEKEAIYGFLDSLS